MAVLVIIMGKGIKTMCMLCVAVYVLLQTGRVSSAPKACPDPALVNPIPPIQNSVQITEETKLGVSSTSSTTVSPGESSSGSDSSTIITTTTTEPTTTSTTTPEPPQTTTEMPFYKTRSQVTLYTGSDQTGKKETFRWSGEYFQTKLCYNLPYYLQKKIRSLDTAGTCVEICEELDCSTCHRFHPGTPSHNRLKSLRLHNKVRSTRPCNPVWDGTIPTE